MSETQLVQKVSLAQKMCRLADHEKKRYARLLFLVSSQSPEEAAAQLLNKYLLWCNTEQGYGQSFEEFIRAELRAHRRHILQ